MPALEPSFGHIWLQGIQLAVEPVSKEELSDPRTDMHHLAILGDVVLTLESHDPLIPTSGQGLEPNQVIPGNNLGTNKAPLEIGMDRPGGNFRRRALPDRPGPDFVFTNREERDQTEERVAGPDDPVEAGLGKTYIGQEFDLLVTLETRDLGLDRGADHERRGLRPDTEVFR